MPLPPQPPSVLQALAGAARGVGSGVMGALRGAGNAIHNAPPGALSHLGANMQRASQGQVMQPFNPAPMMQQAMFKQQMEQHKLDREQRRTTIDERTSAYKARLSNLDVNEDGVVSPQEKSMAGLLRAGIAEPLNDQIAMAVHKTSMDLAAPGDGPGFAGTSMEAQAAEMFINSLPPEQQKAARENLARQRLTRESTITTPLGTRVFPGYVLPGEGAAGPASNDGFVPKPITEGEATARYVGTSLLNVGAQMDDFLTTNPDFDATEASGIGASAPGVAGKYLSSGERQTYNGLAEDWASSLVFLRSGVTAREEEVQREMRKWPGPGTKPLAVKEKALQRAQAELAAYQKGYREGRIMDKEARNAIAQLQQKVAHTRNDLEAFRASSGDTTGWKILK